MKFFFFLEAPWYFAVVDGKGEVTAGGEAADAASLQPPDGVTELIGLAPGEAVTIRSAEIPGRRRSHVEAAMPYALEDNLSEDVDALHFTLLDWQPGRDALVAIVSKERLSGWVSTMNEAGLRMDRVLPAQLVLPRYDDNSTTVSPLKGDADGELLYVRTGELTGFAIDRSFLGFWLEDEAPSEGILSITDRKLAEELKAGNADRVRYWDIGQSPEDWFRVSPVDERVEKHDLLHGEFLPSHSSRDTRKLRLALFFGLFATLTLYVSMVLESRQLEARDGDLNQQMIALFRQHFPGEPWLGRPRFQVESLLNARGGQGDVHGFQSLLDVVTGVTREHAAEIEEINYREGAMIVLCNVRSLSVLDDIRAGLQDLPGLDAELLSSGARDNQVTGRFRVSRS